MFSTLFSSIGLHISGLFFLLFVTIIYLRDKKNDTIKSNSSVFYKLLILFTYLVNIFDIGSYYALDCGYKNITGLFARLDLISCFAWYSVFGSYLLSKFGLKDIDINKKKSKRLTIFCIVFAFVYIIASFFFNVDVINNTDNNVYTLSGNYIYLIYSAIGIDVIIHSYCLIARFKELDIIQIISLIFLEVSYISLFVLKLYTNNDFSDIPYVCSIYVIAFYFTIEGTDYQAAKALTESKSGAEKMNDEIYNFFDNLNVNAINPLSNMYNYSNSLRFKKEYTYAEIMDFINYISDEKQKVLDEINKDGDIK